MEEPAGKSFLYENNNPKKLARILMIKAIINTAVLFFVSIMADTAGMIRKENTGMTPFIFTANTIARPIEI
jgi:hypothetical protein